MVCSHSLHRRSIYGRSLQYGNRETRRPNNQRPRSPNRCSQRCGGRSRSPLRPRLNRHRPHRFPSLPVVAQSPPTPFQPAAPTARRAASFPPPHVVCPRLPSLPSVTLRLLRACPPVFCGLGPPFVPRPPSRTRSPTPERPNLFACINKTKDILTFVDSAELQPHTPENMFFSRKTSEKICTARKNALILQPQTGNKPTLKRRSETR